MAFDKSKFLERFIQEAREHIARFNTGVLELEKTPDNRDVLDGIFRSAHTIKGSSRMMKILGVSEVAHRLEDILDARRQGRIPHSRRFCDLMFEGVDAITVMLDQVAGGGEANDPPEAICEKLEKAVQELAGAETPPPDTSADIQETVIPEEKAVPPEKTPEMPVHLKISATVVQKNLSPAEPASVSHPSGPSFKGSQKIGKTIRVDTEKLDEVVKLMGEFLSAHSKTRLLQKQYAEISNLARRNLEMVRLLQESDSLSEARHQEMIRTAHTMNRTIRQFGIRALENMGVQELLSRDLQDRSVKLRMVPLSTIFDALPRTIRDIAKSCAREVVFTVSGEDTELDKDIIEKLGDPLVHMLRNSIDHGIESPEVRKACGKPLKGVIRLAARYEGGNVLIRLSDDGQGIPVRKIREKALARKMISPDEAEKMEESEIINLIFRPGLTTSELITDISGRGVGMDVVYRNIVEDLKGTIQIETSEGQGSVFDIRLPLTMAVIHVLYIRSAGMTIAIPAHMIREILRTDSGNLIDVVGRQAIRLRDQIIPIARLDELLSLPAGSRKDVKNLKSVLILIVTSGSEKLGLTVDELLSEESAVIKPLPPHLKYIQWVSGCIISGDNRIINVLHLPRILREARTVRGRDAAGAVPAVETQRTIHILVVDDSVTTREIEKSILESYGYHVTLAGNGVEGFEKAKQKRFDLIVTDVEMPRMDGFALTEKLRADETCQDIPVILVTSLDKESDKRRGIEAGADAYIMKGDFDQSNLLETIRTLVG